MDHKCGDSDVTHSEGVTCLVCARTQTDFIQPIRSQDDVDAEETVCELAGKMGVDGFIKDIALCYRKMRQYNKSLSLNIVLLASIFYTINQTHYIAVEKLLPYSENFIDGCTLFQRIQDIIIRSKMRSPSPSIQAVVEYACNRLHIPPKYWNEIIQIADSISDMYLSHGKCRPHISNLAATAIFIFNRDLGKNEISESDLCQILHLPRPAYKRTLGQIRRWNGTAI